MDFLFGITDDRREIYFNNLSFSSECFLKKYDKVLKENKTTHFKLCKEIGLSESCIRSWKKGTEPNMESIIKIARGLIFSIDYLVD